MFEGVFPPIATPFDERGALALDRLRANIEKWNACGLAGYVVLGSNGEAPHIATDEIAPLVGAVRSAARSDMQVIAGTGQLSTQATIEATKRAAAAGAAAVLVVTPYYYKNGMSADVLKRHYTGVADASPVPVLIYNVPANTALNIPATVVRELAAHENIMGMKDSAGIIDQLAEFVRVTTGMPFQVLCGNFSAFLPSMTFGVRGAILAAANVAPKECVSMFEAARSGDWRTASAIHMRLLPIARAVTSQHGVPGLKAALDLLGYFGGAPREPLLPLSETSRKEIEKILREADLLT
jgi:4-hydroxy-2-oxoglutarate aldolase